MMWHFSDQACCVSDVGSSGEADITWQKSMPVALIYLNADIGSLSLIVIDWRCPTMKRLVFFLTLTATIFWSAASAQVAIDMSALTCAEYLTMPPAQSAEFSAYEEPQHA